MVLRRLIGSVAALLCSACSIHAPAISESDLVFGYAMKSESTRCSRWVTLGLDLRLGGVWSGASLGLSSILALQKSEVSPDGPVAHESGFAAPLGWWTRNADGSERWFGFVLAGTSQSSDPMIFIVHSVIGLDVRTSPLQRGIGIGAARISVLHPDPMESASFLLRFSSRDPERAALIRIDERES
jgi:hypothetical protein